MKLKTRIHERMATNSWPAYGGLFFLNSPLAVELVVGSCELDFMAVDLQHGAISPHDSSHLIRAMAAANPMTTAFVRIPTADKHWFEQSLDAGYVGVIVPCVESAEEARALVAMAYYPPKGDRSYAGTIRAILYDDYHANINDHLILLPQIESKKGLENAEAIVKQDGVSGVLLGPGDLSLSCGWPIATAWSHPPFLEAVKRVVGTCQDTGKLAAIVVLGTEQAQRAKEAGFHLISHVTDAVFRTQVIPQINEGLGQLRGEMGS